MSDPFWTSAMSISKEEERSYFLENNKRRGALDDDGVAPLSKPMIFSALADWTITPRAIYALVRDMG